MKSLYKQLLKSRWTLQYMPAHDSPDEYGLPPSLTGNSIVSISLSHVFLDLHTCARPENCRCERGGRQNRVWELPRSRYFSENPVFEDGCCQNTDSEIAQWLQRKTAFFREHREIRERDVYVVNKTTFLGWIEDRFNPRTVGACGATQDLCLIVGRYVFWVDRAAAPVSPSTRKRNHLPFTCIINQLLRGLVIRS